MKAFLKCSEGFIFLRKCTTIGRHENSDIVLKYPDIDNHHALIEFNEEDGSFILQDFNSLSGTFVNNCHIQNAAVKLIPGDVLRFGSRGLTYELVVEFLTSARYSAWPRLLDQHQNPGFTTQLPFLHHRPMSAHRSWSQGLMEGTQPRPPMEKRPISAGGRRALTIPSEPIGRSPVKQVWTSGGSILSSNESFFSLDRRSTASHDKGRAVHLNKSDPVILPYPEQPHLNTIPQMDLPPWVSIANARSSQDFVIQDLGRQINHFSGLEMEFKHKDTMIANRPNEVTAISQKLMEWTAPRKTDVGMDQKLKFLHWDINDKKFEIQSFKDQNQSMLVHMQQSQPISKPQLEQSHLVSISSEVSSQEDIIQQLGQEVTRLSGFEMESKHKDTVIANLRNEVATMSQRLMISQTIPSENGCPISRKLDFLAQDIGDKKNEIQSLKDQITGLQKGYSDMLCQTLSERNTEIAHLKTEGESLKKDKEMSSELVATLKKDIGSKNDMVQKLRQEVDKLKRENQEKDYQLSAITSRCAQLKEDLKKDDLEAKEKELKSCKTQIRDLEQQIKSLGEQLQKSCKEQSLISKTLKEKNKAEEKLQDDSKKKVIQLQEMGYRERLIRANLDKAVSQLEHFRSQIIEAIYGRGKLPQSRIVTNQQLVETISHVIEDNFNLQQKKMITNKSNSAIGPVKEELLIHMEKLKVFLNDCQTCLRLSCCGNDLRKQLSDLQKLQMDPSVTWLHKAILEILQIVVCWVEEIEQLLDDVGIELSNSDKGLSLYLIKFLENHKKTTNKNQELQAKLDSLQESHHSLLQRMKEQTLEHEKQIKEQIKQLQEKQEEENRVWKNNVAQEKNKAKAAVEEEKKKVQDLENHLRKLKKEVESRSQEEGVLSSHLNEALDMVEESHRTNNLDHQEKEALTLRLNKALTELSEARKKQILLGEQLLEQQETLKSVQEEGELQKESLEMEIIQYKEQVKQHSQTIVTLEERLQKVTQQNKDIEQKIASLQENMPVQNEKQNDPLLKNFPNGRSYDHLMEEFMVAQKQLISQHELIIALKTDLSKGHARMSNLKAEFDEQLKSGIGKNYHLVQQQEQEMSELQEKLIQMSNLVEKKNKEIESLKICLRHSIEAKKTCMTRDVATQMDGSDTFIINQEASSFIELGTKCKGFRHEEIIQRQKKALSELREQIKELEKAAAPSAVDEEMETLPESKKPKLGKNSKMAEKEPGLPCLPNIDLRMGNKTFHPLVPNILSNSSTERSARSDSNEALDLSEKLYIDMSKTLSSLMNIKDMSGHVSMKYLSQKDREKVNQLRQRDLDLVFEKISQLKNRLERKEELLREYEKDNEALRQSKVPLQVYQAQVSKLEDEIYKEAEEKALLKEALERTEHQLNMEKRMNRAMKQQKERLEEQEQRNSKETSIYSCLQKERQKPVYTEMLKGKVIEPPAALGAKKIALKTEQEKDPTIKESSHKGILDIIFPKSSGRH